MAYSDLTFDDPNPVKRWLQWKRLLSACDVARRLGYAPSVVCDFGAGNGELCRLLSMHYPKSRIICFEPTPYLLDEARSNLEHVPNIEFVPNLEAMEPDSIDLLFTLEVFEHLPDREMHLALQSIHSCLKHGGHLIIGVPVEVGLPALYKGVFRMARRFGAFDASPKNILLAIAGRPPDDRPRIEITPGSEYHLDHLGFDHRRLVDCLEQFFDLERVSASPFPLLGTWLMPEVYFQLAKR